MSEEKKPNGFSNFVKKIYNPPSWVAWLTIATTLIICPLMILSQPFEYGYGITAVVGAVICVFLLVYAIVVSINAIIKLRKKLLLVADKYSFTRNLYKSYEFRTLFFTVCSFLCNVGYTIVLVVMALVYESVWYGTVGVYYIVLTISRGGVLLQNTKDEKKFKEDPDGLQLAKVGTYRYCGFMMLGLALALGLSVAELVIDSSGFRLAGWLIYVFAAVALYRIITAVIHFIRASKGEDLAVRSMRYLNLAVTLMSILCLQTSIVAWRPPTSMTTALINGITGGVVCLITLALGLYMVIYAGAEKKRLTLKKKIDEGAHSPLETGYNRDGYGEEYEEKVYLEVQEEESYENIRRD